jgi:flagellin-specific chaperone FliS
MKHQRASSAYEEEERRKKNEELGKAEEFIEEVEVVQHLNLFF